MPCQGRVRRWLSPLSIPDRPDPGSDRLGLWGEAESRRCSDPAALLHVVYLQVLAPAQSRKNGIVCFYLFRQGSESDNAGSSNRRCGPCGAAKNRLDLDHGFSRFSRPNGPGIMSYLDMKKSKVITAFNVRATKKKSGTNLQTYLNSTNLNE